MLKHFDYNDDGYIWLDVDNIIGICAVDPEVREDGHRYITIIDVPDPYKHRGIGRQLVNYCTDHLHADALTVRKGNKIAIRLYEKCGFKIERSTKHQHIMVTDSDVKEYVKLRERFFHYITEASLDLPKGAKAYRLDKWGTSPSMNTLYITGISGSGKSTLATQLKDKDTYIVHLDSLFDNPDGPKDSSLVNWLEKHCPDYIKIGWPKDKISMEDWAKIVDRVAVELEKWSAQCYKEGKKVIVEGVQLLDDTIYPQKNFFAGKPVIMLNTGVLKSIHRANKRDDKKFRLADLSNAHEWKKDMKIFKKGVNKNV